MESSWRQNVIEGGVGDMGATLAGINYTDASVTVYLLNDKFLGSFSRVEVYADMQLPYYIHRIAPTGGATRFPYGWFVYPDTPM